MDDKIPSLSMRLGIFFFKPLANLFYFLTASIFSCYNAFRFSMIIPVLRLSVEY